MQAVRMYSYISSINKNNFKKIAKMDALGLTGATTALNVAGSYVTGLINEKFQKAAEERQWKRQMDLYNLQYEQNSPENRRKQLEDAGLSVGLMYGNGTSAGGGSVAAMPSTKSNIDTTSKVNLMDILAQKANIDLMQANAKKADAEAKNLEADTLTKENSRQAMIEKLNQEGIGKYLENVSNNWKLTGSNNLDLDYNGSGKGLTVQLNENAYIAQEASNILLKTIADTGNQSAQAALNNEKAKGYFQELLNSTAHADADKVKAYATKLATEWGTGEFTNWKSWVDLTAQGLNVLSKIK